jgi:hypothetical protein
MYRNRYRLCVLLLGTALTAALGVLFAKEGVPHADLLCIFGSLIVLSENRDRVFGDETSLSGSIIVAICAVFAFSTTTPLLVDVP